MRYLIRIIIKRMEDIESKGIKVFSKERTNIVLDPEKHNKEAINHKRHQQGCC